MIASHWTRLGIAATIALALAPSIAGATSSRSAVSEHSATSACAANALTVLTWTNFAAYATATPVALTTTLRNSGSASCRVTLGATSPLVRVRGANGSVAWSSCGVTTPCPLYLMVMTLAPGASRVTTWDWNQRIRGRVAPRDTYSVETTASGATAKLTTFRLGTRTIQPTIVVGPSDNARRVTLSRGATLVVRLAPRGLYVWSAPTGSPLLTTQLSLGGTSLLARYVARAPGSAVVRASATPSCYPQCLLPSLLYQLRVTITN